MKPQPIETPKIHGNLYQNLPHTYKQILTRVSPPKYPTLSTKKTPSQYEEK